MTKRGVESRESGIAKALRGVSLERAVADSSDQKSDLRRVQAPNLEWLVSGGVKIPLLLPTPFPTPDSPLTIVL
ncbi:hypothetical protein [Allocoleopsis sp.]|uniref:hypothetical protein n=1 Tax=Allocoleopsis sp. TaxID=3088169 RepID=UPI002FD5E01B